MSQDSDFLELGLNDLELKGLELPRLTYRFGVKLAQAKKDAKVAERVVDLIYAKVEKEVRENPITFFGDLKPTEPAIKSCILRQKRVQDAEQAHIEAEYQVHVLEAAMKALSAKRQMISDLTDLHGQMYWAKPTSGASNKQKQKIRERQEKVEDDDLPF